jgi:pimeloyl-ACP methyl ester carboxylesterase
MSEWEPCTDQEDLECATLAVPLDWAEPDGDTIDLRVGRLATDGDRIGSLLFNPGGPGEPGVPFLQDFIANNSMPEGLGDRFDLVSWDPRGTGESSPIECTTDDELEQPGLDPTPDDANETQLLEADIRESSERCVAQYPDLIEEIGTLNTVRDLDALRQALGDEKLNYVGYSYGTLIGEEYLDLFGDRVRAMVLDGIVLPGTDVYEHTEGQLKSFEANLGTFLEDCAGKRKCFGNGDPKGALDQLVAQMDAGLRIPGDYELGGPAREGTVGIEELYYGIVVALYSEDSWSILQQALADAMAPEPDGSTLLYLRDIYRGRDPETGKWNSSTDAFGAIGCADQVERSETPLGDPALPQQYKAEYPFFGGLFGLGLPGCYGFPEPQEPIDTMEPGAIDDVPPVVIVSSTGDPATPYENGAKIQEVIDGSVLVTWEGNDHTAYRQVSDCIDEPITTYLIDLVPPEDGLRCDS